MTDLRDELRELGRGITVEARDDMADRVLAAISVPATRRTRKWRRWVAALAALLAAVGVSAAVSAPVRARDHARLRVRRDRGPPRARTAAGVESGASRHARGGSRGRRARGWFCGTGATRARRAGVDHGLGPSGGLVALCVAVRSGPDRRVPGESRGPVGEVHCRRLGPARRCQRTRRRVVRQTDHARLRHARWQRGLGRRPA